MKKSMLIMSTVHVDLLTITFLFITLFFEKRKSQSLHVLNIVQTHEAPLRVGVGRAALLPLIVMSTKDNADFLGCLHTFRHTTACRAYLTKLSIRESQRDVRE